jgi:hypothetical protein
MLIIYATDEDVALRASADFPILCPKDQKLSAGSDGAFFSSEPWILNSATVDFPRYGLTPGQIVQLTKPITHYRPPGESLVIASVATGAVTLRRMGQKLYIGQPPAPIAGLTGVEFSVVTLGPQLEAASYDLNRRFGIDDLVVGRRASELYDPREVREATVLTVLYRQYLSMSRDAGDQRDNFAAKALAIKSDLDELLARIVIHWPTDAKGGTGSATTHFSTRLVR